ncbi:initiation factor, subunit 2 family protein [Ancylostoma duodenale]|uniref:Translation initiation factor eIF2B subunit delta n=1 Tax=Ancylostoma duodenale TaxID=51022 RepID=A0A0C2FZ75_9BILA|nr:initiation factor, subunit 2 family protein [Ancylostoma duodenale]
MGVVLGAAQNDIVVSTKSSPDRTPNQSQATGKSVSPSNGAQDVKPHTKDAQTSKESKPTPYNAEQHSTMSAEEKKAQRANKAAEKKARAEAAAAKKAAAAAGQADAGSAPKEQKKKPERVNNQNQKPPKGPTPSEMSQPNGDVNQIQNEAATHAPGKSALRSDAKHQTAREVKFVPIGPVSECPDPPSTAHIHPAFLNLAVRCEQEMIDEVDTLCLNFIAAFKEYLADWSSQRQKENKDPSSLGHDLDLAIRPQIAHLTQDSRWPLPYALGNLVRQLKKEIIKTGTPDRSGRVQTADDIRKWLDDCEEEYFGSAYRAISDYLLGKMKTAPNVITYDWCPLVNKVLLDSIEKGFQTVFTVVDPEMEGRGLRHIKSFTERGIRCRYTDLNSVGAVMKNGSMVLLGCAAVLSNGCVVAPKGSMLLALAAKAFNVPVLIVSQTFKFVDKVQASGRVALLGRESMELVPSDLITAIVTDIRVLPPTSAPAVLKAKALDLE